MAPDTRTDGSQDTVRSDRPTASRGRTAPFRPGGGEGPQARWDRLAPEAVPADAGLRRRYEAYRRRQGAELLSMVPRDGVRALYRAAREAGRVAPEGGPEDVGGDAIGELAAYCAGLLPLPPFQVWLADFEAHRSAHLEEAGAWSPSPEAGTVTVDLRSFTDAEGRTWHAALDVTRTPAGCRGSIAFHAGPGSRQLRTGEVFREDDVDAVRARFSDFDVPTLRAFLRSVLP